MTALHSDHLRLLQLADAAFRARDARTLWRENPQAAAEEHGFHCDALWDELGRQLADQHGAVQVLEHPSVKRRKMVANMRREIVATAQNAIIEALDGLADGPMMEDDEND
jgi:hypothetical protein